MRLGDAQNDIGGRAADRSTVVIGVKVTMFKGRSLGRPPKVARISQTVETSSEPIQWAPEETDADSKREQVVLRMTDFNRPENTTRAYEGKTEEYYEYCDAVYPRDRG